MIARFVKHKSMVHNAYIINYSKGCFCMLSSNLSNCSVVGGVVTCPLTHPLTSDGNSGYARDEWELLCEWALLNRRRK